METIAIGLAEPAGELRARIDAALAPLRARGVRTDLSESRRGSLHFLACSADAGTVRPEAAAAASAELRRALVAVLCAWILERREPALLRRIVASHYSYFGAEEREAIAALARADLGPPDGSGAGPSRRRARIAQRLGEYLERHPALVLDGFVTFRLKEHVDDLVAAVDRAVDEFLLEREYREFVDLLSHVVESQPERPPAVHCLFRADGRVLLEDEAGRPVDQGMFEDGGPAAAAREIGVEDLLISALITVAPREVRLHLPEGSAVALSPEVLGTLSTVFRQRVAVCRGCPRCARRAEG